MLGDEEVGDEGSCDQVSSVLCEDRGIVRDARLTGFAKAASVEADGTKFEALAAIPGTGFRVTLLVL